MNDWQRAWVIIITPKMGAARCYGPFYSSELIERFFTIFTIYPLPDAPTVTLHEVLRP